MEGPLNPESSSLGDAKNSNEVKLTEAQLKRIERNRLKALQLRKARIANLSQTQNTICQKEVNIVSRPRDTGGGFLLEEDVRDVDNPALDDRPVVNAPAPLFSEDRPSCEECNQEFVDSYLQKHFDCLVCDSCRDPDGNHCLISKTDAKKEYMLKDCDLDKREPPLKYILKKNPHNVHGSMKLYLRLQVEKRAFEVHGSEEEMEEIREQKAQAQEKRKQRAFDKKVKALRMAVRSSLYRKTERGHDHVYGAETYNRDDDVYEKTCTTCGHKISYEKM